GSGSSTSHGPRERSCFPPRGDVPQLHFAGALDSKPTCPGGQSFAIRSERHSTNGPMVPIESGDLAPRADIPEHHLAGEARIVPGASSSRQDLAVGREGDRPDPMLMPLESIDQPPCRNIPQFDGCVATSRRESFAVEGERHGADRILVPAEREPLVAL